MAAWGLWREREDQMSFGGHIGDLIGQPRFDGSNFEYRSRVASVGAADAAHHSRRSDRCTPASSG